MTEAHAGYGNEGWEVALNFDGEGAKIFGKITEAHVNHRFAVVLDGVIQSAPNIREPITGAAPAFPESLGSRKRAASRACWKIRCKHR